MTTRKGLEALGRGCRPRRICAVALGLAAGLVAPAAAFEAGETRVITPNRTERPLDQVASAITVITRAELEQRQLRYVSDALRAVPGLAVNRAGSVGGLTQVRMRGAEGNHTLVLIDGIEMNDPALSELDFGNLMVGDIERIEVLRGPQSVLYGSEAIGGVINIVTRRGERGLAADGRVELGAMGTRSGMVALRGGDEVLAFALESRGTWTDGVSHADRDNGNHERDPFGAYTLSGRLDFTPRDGLGLDGALHLTRSRVGVDGFVFPSPADADLRTAIDQLYGIVNARFQLFDDRLASRISASFTGSERENRGFDAVLLRRDTFSDGERLKLEFQTLAKLDASNQLVLGAESERESAHSGTTIDDRRVRTSGYFAEYQLALRERLFLTAGMRLDDHQLFGVHPTYRLTAAYRIPSTATKLKATWGTGFASPTMDDLFFESPFFVGNPRLDPERSRSWDVGVEQALLGKRLDLDLTYFENRMRDLIALDDSTFPLSVTNVNRSSARGIELALRARVLESLELTGAYTFTWTHSEETHARLLRRPAHIGSLFVNYRPLRRANLNLGVHYNGRQHDFGPTRLGGYTLVHLALSWQLTDALSLLGRIENLFNADYEELAGFGSLGRSLYAGLAFRF